MRALYEKVFHSIFEVAEFLAPLLPWLWNQAKNFIAGLLPALLCAAFSVFFAELAVPVAGIRYGFTKIWWASPAGAFIGTIDQCELGTRFLVRAEVPLALAIVLVAFFVGEKIRKADETRPVFSSACVLIVTACAISVLIDALLAANAPLTDAGVSCVFYATIGQSGWRW